MTLALLLSALVIWIGGLPAVGPVIGVWMIAGLYLHKSGNGRKL